MIEISTGMFVVIIIIVLMIGAGIGVLITCLMRAAKDDENEKNDRINEPILLNNPCAICMEFPCVELDIKSKDKDILKRFTKKELQKILEDGLTRTGKCIKKGADYHNIMTLFGRPIVRFKSKTVNTKVKKYMINVKV